MPDYDAGFDDGHNNLLHVDDDDGDDDDDYDYDYDGDYDGDVKNYVSGAPMVMPRSVVVTTCL